MTATIRYVLLTALRDRFLLVILLALLGMVGVCILLAASAISEGRELGLAYAGELSRLILVLGMAIFVSFHVSRLYETREIEAILARPLSRASFVLAYYAAFAVPALLLAVLVAPLLIAGLGANGLGLLEWEGSLLLEMLIMVAMSLFCAMALPSPSAAVMVTLGFYALARSAAFFLAIAQAGTGPSQTEGATVGSAAVMTVVAAIMPRLDLFGQSAWLVSGPGGQWGLGELALQSVIYVPLLLVATIRDLHVKQF